MTEEPEEVLKKLQTLYNYQIWGPGRLLEAFRMIQSNWDLLSVVAVPYAISTQKYKMKYNKTCVFIYDFGSLTEPKFASQYTESLLVVFPVAVEIDGAVFPFLEDLQWNMQCLHSTLNTRYG